MESGAQIEGEEIRRSEINDNWIFKMTKHPPSVAAATYGMAAQPSSDYGPRRRMTND
jgi:hypothetical protein